MSTRISLARVNHDTCQSFSRARIVSSVGLAGGVALLACDAGRTPSIALDQPIDVRSFVVGSVVNRLDADGHYVLELPSSPRIITPQRAVQLAIANVRMFGPSDRPYLERQFGAAIDFAALVADPRVYYAESPYEQNLPAEFHPAFHKVIGPYYLVSLGTGGQPVLSVAVSAYNTDIEVVDGSGILRFPARHGADFRVQGVSRIGGTPVPVSPERATRIAAELSGARIVAVPELILPGRGYVPQYARWRVQLERSVTLRGRESGRAYSGREFYVGLGGEVSAAVATQPDGSPISDPDDGRSLNVPRRATIPLVFEPVGR